MITRVAALLLALTCITAQAEPQDPLFKYAGKPYVVEDLSARMQQLHAKVMQEHYESMRALVDEMLQLVWEDEKREKKHREQGGDEKAGGRHAVKIRGHHEADDHAEQGGQHREPSLRSNAHPVIDA